MTPSQPSPWMRTFENPGPEFRPLQIVHHPQNIGRYGCALNSEISTPPTDAESLRAGLRHLRKLGLGGLVTNVSFANYMKDETSWRIFSEVVGAARELGLRVWIYDEDGYPSGAAGGLVLEGRPELESLELVCDDAALPGKFVVRQAFEGTHAANNFYAVRRHPNLLDERATERFLEVTHQTYRRKLGEDLFSHVEAFFTDEPSMMAFNIGLLPDHIQEKVRIQDPPDPAVRRLPAVPWVRDLPEKYRQRWNDDLSSRSADLFSGDTEEARETRRRFWTLLAELSVERYFGKLERWCAAHGVASSGHALCEESLVMNPTVDGNTLRALQRMHIPGVDVLSAKPEEAARQGLFCLTVCMAASAATLNGTRRVMSESSDHSQRLNGEKAGLEWMLASAAYQYAFGVTDFTLYFSPETHAEAYPRYCAAVGRMGALLRDAERLAPVALYYPIRDVWAHYRPTAEALRVTTQPPRLQTIIDSFNRAVKHLYRAGVPVCLVDHDHLAQAEIVGGKLKTGAATFSVVAFSDVDPLPDEARRILMLFTAAGGKTLNLLHPEDLTTEKLLAWSPFPVAWNGFGGIQGVFRRDDQLLALLVNTTADPLSGICLTPFPTGGVRWDVYTGQTSSVPTSSSPLPFTLAPFEAVIFTRPWKE